MYISQLLQRNPLTENIGDNKGSMQVAWHLRQNLPLVIGMTANEKLAKKAAEEENVDCNLSRRTSLIPSPSSIPRCSTVNEDRHRNDETPHPFPVPIPPPPRGRAEPWTLPRGKSTCGEGGQGASDEERRRGCGYLFCGDGDDDYVGLREGGRMRKGRGGEVERGCGTGEWG